MAKYKKLANAVAPQLGRLQGELESKVKKEALKLSDKFVSSCPIPEELEKIIKVRNILVNNLDGFRKRAKKIASIASVLELPISATKIYIILLKVAPRPSTIGTPPGAQGGVIYSETTGQIAARASKLRNAELLVDNLEDDVATIKAISGGVDVSLGGVITLLNSVDINVQKCVEDLATSGADISNLVLTAQPRENTGSEGTPEGGNYTYRSASGRDYVLAIIEDTSVTGPAPRRVAVAKDNIGVIILRGQPSFSSSTQVLLDELKFKIDNQLP
jgi:hypothetical protein